MACIAYSVRLAPADQQLGLVLPKLVTSSHQNTTLTSGNFKKWTGARARFRTSSKQVSGRARWCLCGQAVPCRAVRGNNQPLLPHGRTSVVSWRFHSDRERLPLVAFSGSSTAAFNLASSLAPFSSPAHDGRSLRWWPRRRCRSKPFPVGQVVQVDLAPWRPRQHFLTQRQRRELRLLP